MLRKKRSKRHVLESMAYDSISLSQPKSNRAHRNTKRAIISVGIHLQLQQFMNACTVRIKLSVSEGAEAARTTLAR